MFIFQWSGVDWGTGDCLMMTALWSERGTKWAKEECVGLIREGDNKMKSIQDFDAYEE